MTSKTTPQFIGGYTPFSSDKENIQILELHSIDNKFKILNPKTNTNTSNTLTLHQEFYPNTSRNFYNNKQQMNLSKISKLSDNKSTSTKKRNSLITKRRSSVLSNLKNVNIREKVREILDEIRKETYVVGVKKDKENRPLRELEIIIHNQHSVPRVLPKIMTQAKFNKYLINDFRDDENYVSDYIQRSLKYKEINENFEVLADREKERKNQNLMDSDFMRVATMFNDSDYYKRKSLLFSNPKKFYFKEKKEKPTRGTKPKNTVKIESSILEKNKKKAADNAETQADKLIYDRMRKSRRFRSNKTFRTYREFHKDSNDKYKTNSIKSKKDESFYRAQRNYFQAIKQYNKYVHYKQKLRAQNFCKELRSLEKEKYMFPDKFKVDENSQYASLNEGELGHQLNFNRILKNSYNTVVMFQEGDHDLDLDNLDVIKQNKKDTEFQLVLTLRGKNVTPGYIKNNFNVGTVGKYRSTRGVFFGNK